MRLSASFEKTKRLITLIGASLLGSVIALPAFAIVDMGGHHPVHAAALGAQQYADEDDVPPWLRFNDDERAEHERHEQEERWAREHAHQFGERQEERAEHLQDRLNRERAEHERHEMREERHEHDRD
jgi:hypothetical protein